jgi:radical SAM superfamily enzyme YgiQ (UPF0313 family)
MNILFLTSAPPPRSAFSTNEKRPPLGIGYLIGVLKRQGHKIFFKDNYLRPTDVLSSHLFLINNRIDLVCIHTNTICYQSSMQMFHQLHKFREKRVWEGKIAVGGPHTSFGAETIPDFIDHIVIGEGEKTLSRIAAGDVLPRVIQGEKIDNLDSLPLPAWEEFIYLPYDWTHGWVDNAPVYIFNTSRGCPFNCAFCSVKGVWGRTYRYMSAERVVHDVEYMQRIYGMKVAYFREDHFTLNPRRTVDFCEKLIERNVGIEWMCETRADSIDDPESMSLLAKSGCRALYIGVESGSPRMLEIMKKGETVEQFVRVFDLAKKNKIKTYASFVVGVPGETKKDLEMTRQLIDRIKPDFLNMNIYAGLPGSEFYDKVKNEKLYEYEDENGILYLKGHNDRVDYYHGGNIFLKIPKKIDEESICDSDNLGIENINFDLINHRIEMPRNVSLLEAYLEHEIIKAWNKIKTNENIALYGAGTHTVFILPIIRRLGLKMPTVIFDTAPERALCKEIKVAKIDDIDRFEISLIFISNDNAHYGIYSSLKNNPKCKKITITNPYIYLPQAPFERK